MRTTDKYLNLPSLDITKGCDIDQVFKIHEERITEECIEHVSKKLGMSKAQVREIHNFQWAKVKEAIDNMKMVYVYKFFKIRISPYKGRKYVEELKKEIAYLDEKIENSLKESKRKELKVKKKELEDRVAVLEKQIENSDVKTKRENK